MRFLCNWRPSRMRGARVIERSRTRPILPRGLAVIGVMIGVSLSAVPAQLKKPVRLEICEGDLRSIVTSIPRLQLRESSSEHLHAERFRDVSVRGNKVHVVFTVRYQKFADVPYPTTKRVRKKVLGKWVSFDVPVVRTKRKRVLSLSPDVQAHLVLERHRGRHELKLRIDDIDLPLPGPIKDFAVREVKKRADRTLASTAARHPLLGVHCDLALAAPGTQYSTLELEGEGLTAVLRALLRRKGLRLPKVSAEVKDDGVWFADAGPFFAPDADFTPTIKSARLDYPRFHIHDRVIRMDNSLHLKGVSVLQKGEADPSRLGDGTITSQLSVQLEVDASRSLRLKRAGSLRRFVRSERPAFDLIVKRLSFSYREEMEDAISDAKVPLSSLDVPFSLAGQKFKYRAQDVIQNPSSVTLRYRVAK